MTNYLVDANGCVHFIKDSMREEAKRLSAGQD